MLISLLKQFNIDFCTVFEDGVTDIILMMPYFPFEEYPKHCAKIDSFYIASNTLYKKAKQISVALTENGFEVIDRRLNLKTLAQKGGLGSILHNQLLVNCKHGSKVTLQGISVKGEFEHIANGSVKVICDSCHKCDYSCPNQALNCGAFTREKCIRHMQDFAVQYFSEAGGRTLGCEECQSVCPYNAKIPKIKMPSQIENLFDYQNIFDMIKGGKKQLAPLAEIIGSNIARPVYMFNLLVNSLISSNNFEYTDTINSFENHQSQSICDKVKFYLEKADKKLQK